MRTLALFLALAGLAMSIDAAEPSKQPLELSLSPGGGASTLTVPASEVSVKVLNRLPGEVYSLDDKRRFAVTVDNKPAEPSDVCKNPLQLAQAVIATAKSEAEVPSKTLAVRERLKNCKKDELAGLDEEITRLTQIDIGTYPIPADKDLNLVLTREGQKTAK